MTLGARIAVGGAALLLVAAQACSSSLDLVDSVVGSYVLTTVDGEALPVADGNTEITAGRVDFERDHDCSTSITRSTGTARDTCVWARAGSTLTLTWSDDSIEFMSFTDPRITATRSGRPWVFEKQ